MVLSIGDIIRITSTTVTIVYKIAVTIQNSEDIHAELRDSAKAVLTNLALVESIFKKLQYQGKRVSTDDEKFLCENVEILKTVILDTKMILEEIQSDRGFVQRLFMKKNEYKRRLQETSQTLNSTCLLIQGAIPGMRIIQINRREFGDFRKLFSNQPTKSFTTFDTSFVNTSPKSSPLITSDTNQYSCFIKLGEEELFFSYHLRTWFTTIPTETIRALRQNEISVKIPAKIRPSIPENSLNLLSPILPFVSSAPSSPSLSPRNSHPHLDLSEFFMSHDTICGIAVTESIFYIATKYEITSVSLNRKRVIRQYGSEGNESDGFNQICFLYINPDDQTSLYVVDRGHSAVHQYKINDKGVIFTYIRTYSVIAELNQTYHLVSCTIHNQYLYVSDQANNCLHVFPLNGQRQLFYLTDTLVTSFSPGYLCTHGKYLYVTNCSKDNSGILVFNEECQPIDWFRHHSLGEILAMDIDTTINELYILTTTGDNTKEKQPLIITMDSSIRR